MWLSLDGSSSQTLKDIIKGLALYFNVMWIAGRGLIWITVREREIDVLTAQLGQSSRPDFLIDICEKKKKKPLEETELAPESPLKLKKKEKVMSWQVY